MRKTKAQHNLATRAEGRPTEQRTVAFGLAAPSPEASGRPSSPVPRPVAHCFVARFVSRALYLHTPLPVCHCSGACCHSSGVITYTSITSYVSLSESQSNLYPNLRCRQRGREQAMVPPGRCERQSELGQ